MHIGLWLTYLEGLGGWRLPDSGAEDFNSIEPYAEIARLAERGKLDAVIRGDGVGIEPRLAGRHPSGGLELITLLSALAARTEKVGLIGTVSTTFSDPYNVARQLASLDHLSRGRVGWNIVTSSGGERNFGYVDIPDQDERYERADEYIEVATALWDSWEPGSVVLDRERGIYADADRIHPIDHVGKHFRVAGPLNVSRSPQGRPVLIQAGSSERGRQFAAKHAEVIFTAAQTFESAHEFYTDVRGRIRAEGRDPDAVKILPGVSLFLADTDDEARRLHRARLDLIDVEEGLKVLQKAIGDADLSGLDLDRPVPADRLPDTSTLARRQSRPQIFVDLAKEHGYTLRQLIHTAVSTNGHGQVVGGPETIAERLIAWYRDGAADGYVLFPALGFRSIHVFVEQVLPILRAEGLFRTEYEGSTLREHLGLDPVPQRARTSALAAS
jgi:FMN-dependent oxidoreductase (nitrilotriacetate monooxygenase family)